MRICEVMLARGFGGAERYFVDTCRYLAESGHDVLAVCDRRSLAWPLLENHPRLRLAALAAAGTWDPLAVRRLRRKLADWDPDVVQGHLARGAHIGGKAARALNKPVLVMTHNYVDLKYYRNVDCFMPGTEDQARYLREAGVPGERIRLIPHFSALAPVPRARATAGSSVTALGRFVPKKGFDVLLEAVARLCEGVPDIRLALGGDGPSRADLENQARELGLEGRVQFAGWQNDVSAFLNNADLFVLPSREEPFGIVILEAMARGVPVVATTTPGPREILDDTCAWLVAPGDAVALAEAVADALARPEERERRASAALRRFKERYSREVVMPRVVSQLERLAAASRSPESA